MHRCCLSFDCLLSPKSAISRNHRLGKKVKASIRVRLLMPTVSPHSGDSLVQASCIDRTDLPRLLDGKRPLHTQAEIQAKSLIRATTNRLRRGDAYVGINHAGLVATEHVEAYGLLRKIKALPDKYGRLNPGTIFTD